MSHPRLVTPQGMAAFLGSTIDDNDFLANLMCSMASQVVRTYTSQMISFVNDDVVTLNGTGTHSLLLPEVPVVRVSEIVTHDSAGGNEQTLTEDDWAMVASSGWLHSNSCWPKGFANITVTYDHGWDVGVDEGVDPEDNAVDHIPADILFVALRLATRGFLAGTAIEGGGSSIKASETISPDSYSYTNVASDAAVRAATASAQTMASDERALLDRYRIESVA